MTAGKDSSFEDGLAAATDLEDGREILVPGVPVRTSRNAGSYYCAHAFYLLARWAREHPKAPGFGFLHVPADAETTGDAPGAAGRHQRTATVVAAALRGLLDVRPQTSPVRVLLTGYGPFQGVVDNPTGAFVSDAIALKDVLGRATDAAVSELAPLGARIARLRAGPIELGSLVLDVSDDALDHKTVGSLPWALSTFAPDVAFSLGVHRASDSYRVELLPTNAGLSLDGGLARHAHGSPVTDELEEEPLLARAIESGARALSRRFG